MANRRLSSLFAIFVEFLVLAPFFFYPIFMEVPAFLYLLFRFLTQFWSGTLSLTAEEGHVSGIAFLAHVGGFIAGMLLPGRFVKKKRTRTRYVE